MELRSQIIELNIPDDSGKPIRYYTYDGYLEHRDRVAIRKKRKDIEKDTFTSAFLIGWVAYYVVLLHNQDFKKIAVTGLAS